MAYLNTVAPAARGPGLGFAVAAIAPAAAASGPAAPFVVGGAALVSAIGALANKFRKDPAKETYDQARQLIGEEFQRVHDAHQQIGIAAAVQAIDRLIAELEALYLQLRPHIDAAWIDPRFQDQYRFMREIADKWRADLIPQVPITVQSGPPRLALPGNALSVSAQPAGGLFPAPPVMTGGFETGAAPSLAMWAGLAALVFLISRR